MSANYYKKGDPNFICDRCGQKFKRSEMRMTWDGLMVCRYDFEERQPQDLLQSFPDRQFVDDARPDIGAEADSFVSTTIGPSDLVSTHYQASVTFPCIPTSSVSTETWTKGIVIQGTITGYFQINTTTSPPVQDGTTVTYTLFPAINPSETLTLTLTNEF